MATMGPVDYTQLNRTQSAADQFIDSETKGAQALAAMRQRVADREGAMSALKWVASQNLSDKQPQELAGIAAQAGTLLSPDNPYAEPVAKTVHGIIGSAMDAAKLRQQGQPKSVTPGNYVLDATVPGGFRQIGEPKTGKPSLGWTTDKDAKGNPVTKGFGNDVRIHELQLNTATGQPVVDALGKPVDRWRGGGVTPRQAGQTSAAFDDYFTFDDKGNASGLKGKVPIGVEAKIDKSTRDAQAKLAGLQDARTGALIEFSQDPEAAKAEHESSKQFWRDEIARYQSMKDAIKTSRAPKSAPATKQVSLKAARQQYGDTAKAWSDDELKKFLSSQGYNVTE